jgi:hypothetical protein
MTEFTGKWKCQSYRPEPGSAAAGPMPPSFVLWSPPGVVTIHAGGATGTLEFTGTPLKLDLAIRETDGSPKALFISAVLKLPGGKEFTNDLHGRFVPAALGQTSFPRVVRGSIVQTSADIAPLPQPIYTTGYFVLEPLS